MNASYYHSAFSASALIILFSVLSKNWKKKTDLYVKKVQYSVQAAEFKPTHSSLNLYYFLLVWPKIQQILCESTCDFIIFIHYMSKFSKSKIVMQKQKLQIILIIQHYCAQPVKVLWHIIYLHKSSWNLWNSVPAHEIFGELQVNRPSLLWLLYIKAGPRKTLDSYYKSFVRWSSRMLNYLPSPFFLKP